MPRPVELILQYNHPYQLQFMATTSAEMAHPNYSTSVSREEWMDDEHVINPLPRAVTRQTSHLLLDGVWKFALDPEDKGLQEGWHLGHEFEHNANWPGSIENHIHEAKGLSAQTSWSDKVVAWYEREFTLPPHLDGNRSPHTMVQLTFGACGYETTVWLNGVLIHTIEGEAIHIGEYTSFSYELQDQQLRPINRLTVRIADTMDADIPRGKQESHVYKRGGIWYQTYTGAVRSIWIEAVERNRLRSRVGVISIVEDNLVRFDFTTRIHDPGEYNVVLRVFHRKDKTGKALSESQYPLKLEAGEKRQRLVLEVPDAKPWSPEEPTLYKLVAQLVDKDGYVAEIETHFGLRKIESRGCCVYLNNSPVYLDGILYQPGIASYEEIRQHMLAMKKLGCNLVRIHIAGVDPRIYNLADKIGMMLWVEVPSPHQSNHKSRANHKDELLRMLALIGSHPSVVIWSLYNEDWGAQDVASNVETRQYIIDMYHFMKIEYPQFLVVDNDGWQHVSFEGKLKSDLLTAHLYTPDLKRWQELLDALCQGQLVGVAAFPLVVGDPFFYRYQVPLIVSEWGGFGFANYGGPEDDNERTRQIKLFKKELRERQFAGDVYTQATNIEDEKNGLIDPATGALNVPEGLLNSRKRQGKDPADRD